jgi:hypothetical protein
MRIKAAMMTHWNPEFRFGRSISTILALGRREGIEIKTPSQAKAEARKILSGHPHDETHHGY